MWEPAGDAKVRRKAIIQTYLNLWYDLVLPPNMGECASGKQPLWTQCLLALTRTDPEFWDVFASQMPYKESVDEKRWKFVRSITRLDDERLLELFAEAGIKLRLEWRQDGNKRVLAVIQEAPKPQNGNAEDYDEEDDDDEEYSTARPGWEILASKAPFDREAARFFVANYCWVLEYFDSYDRTVELYYA